MVLTCRKWASGSRIGRASYGKRTTSYKPTDAVSIKKAMGGGAVYSEKIRCVEIRKGNLNDGI